MNRANAVQNCFVIKVLNTQNATWQGTITQTQSGETAAFRSVLELIRLMDSALSEHDHAPTVTVC